MTFGTPCGAPYADKKALAEQMIRALPTGNFSSFSFAPDFWAWTATSGRLAKEQFLHRVGLFGALFENSDVIVIDTVTSEDDRVFVQFRVRGTLINGKIYNQSAAFLIEFNPAGAVRHWREYFDTRIAAELLFPAMKELEARRAACGT